MKEGSLVFNGARQIGLIIKIQDWSETKFSPPIAHILIGNNVVRCSNPEQFWIELNHETR